jgi:alpha-ketoglutarate-dependent taurine dioxygenase
MMRENMLRTDYNAFLNDDKMLHRVLLQLQIYGLAFFSNVPSVETEGVEIVNLAMRIGEVKQTFYGKTWDVKSIPDSKNIAYSLNVILIIRYTNLNLGLHMDLMYFNSPPGLQFLHCLRNSVKGGSSIFVDSFRAASLLRLQNSHSFNSLVNMPVQFHYLNDNRHFYFSRPTIVPDVTDPHGLAIDHVNYSPPFQAPFEVDTSGKGKANWRRFITAFKDFATFTEREDMRYEILLQEGECVVFANRRVLHARRAFDISTGERWLKGTYVDWDDYQVPPPHCKTNK